MKKSSRIIKNLAEHLGSQEALGKLLNCSQPTISSWINGSPISLKKCLLIEKLFKIDKGQLRKEFK